MGASASRRAALRSQLSLKRSNLEAGSGYLPSGAV
jgi:hypothetical protein